MLKNGGFDVIIGNPPYVVYSKVKSTYSVLNYLTEDCNDLYAFVMERSLQLQSRVAYLGMIVPVSIASTDGFDSLRKLFATKTRMIWASSYAERPSKLFTGVEKRLTIWLSNAGSNSQLALAKYRRWQADERNHLFEMLTYTIPSKIHKLVGTSIPKTYTPIEEVILGKLNQFKPLASYFRNDRSAIVYYTRKLRYFVQFFDFVPSIKDAKGKTMPPSELKDLSFETDEYRYAAIAALNSSLYFWYLTIHSDVRNVNKREIECFPINIDQISTSNLVELVDLAHRLMQDFTDNSRVITVVYPSRWKFKSVAKDAGRGQHQPASQQMNGKRSRHGTDAGSCG